MSDIRARLDKILLTIQAPNFLDNKGLGNEIGFYIFDYDPRDELLVREHLADLKSVLNSETSNRKVVEFDLFEMMLAMLTGEGVEQAEQEPEVQKQLEELKNPNLHPVDIKVLEIIIPSLIQKCQPSRAGSFALCT